MLDLQICRPTGTKGGAGAMVEWPPYRCWDAFSHQCIFNAEK